MKRSWIPGLLLALALALSATADDKPQMEDVAGKLACFCGTCPHLVATKCGCSTADKIKADVQKKIDAGMTEKQILDEYVAQYGQTVLAAPTFSRFNVTAWLLPFVAFAFGGVVLFKFLKKQQQPPSSGPPAPPPAEKTEEDEAYREQLRKEMEKRQ